MSAPADEARRHLIAGRYKQAVDGYRPVLRENPRLAAAYEGLVRALIEDYRAPEAYATLDEALKRVPDSAEVHTAAGLVAVRRGQFAEAEKAFQAALRVNPKYGNALAGMSNLHNIYSRLRSGREAITQAHYAVPDEPRYLAAYANSIKPRKAHVEALQRAYAMLDPDAREAKALRVHIDGDVTLGERPVKRLASPYRPYVIPMMKMGERMSIRLAINGVQGFRLLLDSGASGIMLRRKSAARAQLLQLESGGTEQRGVGDQTPRIVRLHLARQVRSGDLMLANYPVRVIETGKAGDGDGIIGVDVFQQFLVTLDFAALRMELEPLPKFAAPPEVDDPWDTQGPPGPGFERFYRLRHLIVLPASLNGFGKALYVLDTGAGAHCVDPDAARHATRVAPSRTRVSGLQGTVREVFKTGDAELEFAGVRDRQKQIVAFELDRLSDSIGTEIAGIIGMPGLLRHKVTLDYRSGYIRFSRN